MKIVFSLAYLAVAMAFAHLIPWAAAGIACAGAFGARWGHKRHATEAARDKEALRLRYAPCLSGDIDRDSEAVYKRMDELKVAAPGWHSFMADRWNALSAHYDNITGKENSIPIPVASAYVFDIEYLVKLSTAETRASLFEKMALLNRMADIESWLRLYGTPYSPEELQTAKRQVQDGTAVV